MRGCDGRRQCSPWIGVAIAGIMHGALGRGSVGRRLAVADHAVDAYVDWAGRVGAVRWLCAASSRAAVVSMPRVLVTMVQRYRCRLAL